MTDLIRPEELPRWVPGDVLCASDGLGWRDVSLRSYRYTGLDVEVPPIQDYMIVAYARGPTPMNRRFEGRWSHEDLVPGDVSLLTRAEKSHWTWPKDIDVVHVYLTQKMLGEVSAEVFDRDIDDVRLFDVLRTHDPVLHRGTLALAAETTEEGVGGSLYVDAVARQLSVHILRNYATVSFRESAGRGGLSPLRARHVSDYVETHLERSISLEDLARIAGLSPWHFLRQFKERFGCAPHAWVLRRRLERAKGLLSKGELPIKEVAGLAGFSDQSHLTRIFRRFLGTTPRVFRDSAR